MKRKAAEIRGNNPLPPELNRALEKICLNSEGLPQIRITFEPTKIRIEGLIRADQENYINRTLDQWYIQMQWVAYYYYCDEGIETSLRDKPFNKPKFRAWKQRGKTYFLQLKLCEQVWKYKQIPGYSSALDWWVAQMIEDKKRDLTVPFCTPKVKFKGKKDLIKKYRERLSILRSKWCKGLNSTSLEKERRSLLQEIEEASMPETKKLLEESIKLVLDNNKKFENQFWKPFLEATKAELDALETETFDVVWNDGERLMSTSGRKQGSKPRPYSKELPKDLNLTLGLELTNVSIKN